MSWWHCRTGFCIALAKHCNLIFCSFVLRIDWWKPFLTDYAITCGVNGLNSFMCLWCNTTIVAIGGKCISTTCYPLWRNKGAVRLPRPRDSTNIATSDIFTWHQMWCSQINFWCLMFWRQIWCWLRCCFFSTFPVISGRK